MTISIKSGLFMRLFRHSGQLALITILLLLSCPLATAEVSSDNAKYQVGRSEVSLSIETERNHFYINEKLILTVFATYRDVEIIDARLLSLPSGDGVWLNYQPDETVKQDSEEITIAGERYWRRVVGRYQLSTATAGNLTMPSFPFQLTVKPIAGARAQKLDLATAPFQIEAKELPAAGRPNNFQNIVGHLSIKTSLETKEVIAGKPAHIFILIESDSVFSQATPHFPLLSDVEIDGPKLVNTKDAQNGLQSVSLWQVDLISQNQGKLIIPPLTIDYFDPASQQYCRAQSEQLIIDVAANPMLAGYTSPSLFALIGVLLICALTSLYYQYGRKPLETVKFSFQSTLYHQLELKLDSVERGLATADARDICGQLLQALRLIFHEKLQIPASERLDERVAEMLRERGVDEALSQQISTLFDNCEAACFAPAGHTLTATSLADFVRQARNYIEQLWSQLDQQN